MVLIVIVPRLTVEEYYFPTEVIEASEFSDKSATWSGGALYTDSSTITIEGSKFDSNN